MRVSQRRWRHLCLRPRIRNYRPGERRLGRDAGGLGDSQPGEHHPRHLRDGAIRGVSIGKRQPRTDGGQIDGISWQPAISEDGRYAAFETNANEIAGEGMYPLVFVHDRDADENGVFDEDAAGARSTTIVSVNDEGEPFADACEYPSIGGEGRVVSLARDLSPANGPSEFSELSRDGRHVVFVSSGSNLVGGHQWRAGHLRGLRAGRFRTVNCVPSSLAVSRAFGTGRFTWRCSHRR